MMTQPGNQMFADIDAALARQARKETVKALRSVDHSVHHARRPGHCWPKHFDSRFGKLLVSDELQLQT